MNKYILFAAVAMFILVSCAKETVEQTVDYPISFSAPVVGSMTKAPHTGKIVGPSYPKDEELKVWAKYSDEDLAKWEDGITYMNAVTCKYDSGKNGWIPVGYQYYWPKQGKLTFGVFSPASAPNVTYNEEGVTVTDYTVPEDGKHLDLMYGLREYNKTIGDQTPEPNNPAYSGIDIRLFHALTSVKFKIKKDAEYSGTRLILNSIKLHNVYSKGTFKETIEKQTGGSYADGCTRVPRWVDVSDERDFTYVENSTQELTTESEGDDINKANDMLMIGQKYNHGTTEKPKYISMTVTYTIISSTGVEIEQTHKVELKEFTHYMNMSNNKVVERIQDGWYPGYEYTYIIKIGLKKIDFEPIINEWTPIAENPEITL